MHAWRGGIAKSTTKQLKKQQQLTRRVGTYVEKYAVKKRKRKPAAKIQHKNEKATLSSHFFLFFTPKK